MTAPPKFLIAVVLGFMLGTVLARIGGPPTLSDWMVGSFALGMAFTGCIYGVLYLAEDRQP